MSGDRATGKLAWQALLMACAGGLLLVALGYARNRAGDDGTPLFWIGLLLCFVPVVARCAGASATRHERVGLLLALTAVLYLVKAFQDPLSPTAHDELVSLRSSLDVLADGRLYTPNPVVTAYSDYPGLHILVSQLAQLSGISIWTSALIAVGVARLLMTAALFLVFERLSSARVASLGVLVYMANPGYLLFDARFAYESLALPLVVVVIALLVTRDEERRDSPAAVTALVVAGAVTITHHASSVFLAVLLVVWALLSRRLPDHPRIPRWVWLIPPVLTTLYLAAVSGGAVLHELGPVFRRMGESVVDLVTGQTGPKKAFGAAPGQHAVPLLERLVGFASVLLALVLVASGAWHFRRTRTAIAALLAVLAVLYPATLALRVTEAGSETSNRASEFVFLGLALASGVALVEGARRVGARRGSGAWQAVAAAGAVGLMFAGGIVVGSPWYSRLPGPYRVAADPRSVDVVSRGVARWAADELRPKQRWAADRENALTVTAFGRQNVMTGVVGDTPVADLFFSRPTGATLPPAAQKVLTGKDVHYILADRRLATGLPTDGYYYEKNEPGANEHGRPILLASLTKFDVVAGLDRAYDSGAIVVYRRP